MKKKSILIAFFSISNIIHVAGEIQGSVSSALGGCIRHEEEFSSLVCSRDSSPCCYLTFGNHYLTSELSQFRVEGTLPTPFLSIGASLEWFGYELYHQSRIRFSAGKTVGGHTNLGCAINLNHLNYEGCLAPASHLSCDLFFRYHNSHCEIYGRGSNLFGGGFRDTRFLFLRDPQKLTIGCLIPFSPFANCAIEGCWERDIGGTIHIGMEYSFSHFALRCGAYALPATPTFGIGFKPKNIRIDIATQWAKTLGYYLNIGIGYTFKQKKQ